MRLAITTKDKFSKYAHHYKESEPLFLDPDGTRTRFPIGWKGVGRYSPGTLKVYTTAGEEVDITEEDGGVFYNFSSPPPAGSHKDYIVKYVPRPDDVAFSKGLSNSSFPGEEYFLFPNWIDGPGIGDAFWIGKYQASRSDATTTSQGSSTILASRKNVCPVTYVKFNTWDTLISNKGSRFHRITNREWSNVILWSLKMGIKITGNCYGYMNESYVNIDGEGTDMSLYPADDDWYKTRTGMGPTTWNHNGLEGGIADMCGNVWEAVDGLKLVNNIIYIFDNDTDKNWVSTGLSYSGGLITNSLGTSFGNTLYYPTDSDLWKEMIPCNASGKETITAYGDDGTWFNSGERILYRGGSCSRGSLDGVFAFDVGDDSSSNYWRNGCRLCVKLL